MKQLILIAGLSAFTLAMLQAQGTVYGIKGGFTMATQQWDALNTDALFLPQGDFFIEDVPESNAFSLFASLGYHPKGSALRNRFFNNVFNGQLTRVPPERFIFHNASLVLGAKQKFDIGRGESRFFYSVGVRADYTFDTNLDAFDEINNFFFTTLPVDDPTYIREFNYGVTVGGGMEYNISEFVGLSLELNLHPDFSFQYEQPEIPGVTDPFTGNQTTIPERQIRNIAFEVSLGLRFLRKVVYVD
ncbi:MAG: hypothetical protein RIC19_08200 [Phaeodactylibacter sp.]|uniref:hypothetical protein n=1 Tax=Phaeodactylibacter sp. TaxID=1940289 RepID=UPI0032EB9928